MSMLPINRNTEKYIVLLCIILSGLFFYVDLQFPLGYAAGTTYVAVVVISLLISHKFAPVFFAMLCTLLTVAGIFLSPGTEAPVYALYNRGVSIVVVWTTGFIGLLYRRSREQGEKDSSALEKEIIERLKAEQYINAIVEHASDAIVTIDKSGLILSFNRAAEKMFGHREEEVIGKNVSILMPSPYREEHDGYLDHYLRTGEKKIIGITREVTGLRKDGREFEIEIAVAEVRTGGHHIFMGAMRDITERKRMQDELAYYAHYDSLTGLPNRALFRERLNRALIRAGRNESFLALMFIDLDGFKEVNDTLGHDAGDALLADVAKRFEKCIRESDTIARQGGDEFTVILEQINNNDDARIVAQKLIDTLAGNIEIFGQHIRITASIGITLYPADAVFEVNLLRNADIAMYQAKEQGRNQYQFYQPEMRFKTNAAQS